MQIELTRDDSKMTWLIKSNSKKIHMIFNLQRLQVLCFEPAHGPILLRLTLGSLSIFHDKFFVYRPNIFCLLEMVVSSCTISRI